VLRTVIQGMNLVVRRVPYTVVLRGPRDRAVALDNQRFKRADPKGNVGKAMFVGARRFRMFGRAARGAVTTSPLERSRTTTTEPAVPGLHEPAS
jgi:hypothetical protein